MKTLAILPLILALLISLPCAAGEQDKNLDLMLQKMLFIEDTGVNKLAAKISFNEKLGSKNTIELFAHNLSEGFKGSSDMDLLAWYSKAIGASEDPRFKSLLTHIINNTNESKLRKHANKASKKLGKKIVDEQFDAQKFDYESLKSRLETSYEAGIKNVEKIENVSEGNEIRLVLSTLGLPNNIEQEFVTIRRPYVGAIVTQRLILKYDDVGNVRLGYTKGRLLVERVHAAIDMPKISANSKNAQIIEPILSGTPQQYRQAAQTIYKDGNFEDEILDAAAMRVWQDKDSSDPFAIDGVAWLLKCLGASANPRYKTFISRIIKESSVKKIRKYAKRASESLLEGDVEQFSIQL